MNKNTRQAKAIGQSNGIVKDQGVNGVVNRQSQPIFKGEACATYFGARGNNRLSAKDYPGDRFRRS